VQLRLSKLAREIEQKGQNKCVHPSLSILVVGSDVPRAFKSHRHRDIGSEVWSFDDFASRFQ
jgi:hypothetical protein